MSPLVAVCAAIGLTAAGYLLGRVRPLSRLDAWAWRQVHAARLTGRRGVRWWAAQAVGVTQVLVVFAVAPRRTVRQVREYRAAHHSGERA